MSVAFTAFEGATDKNTADPTLVGITFDLSPSAGTAILNCRTFSLGTNDAGLANARRCPARRGRGHHDHRQVRRGRVRQGADKIDRPPQLAAALASAKTAKCCVLVSKRDRLSRDVAFVAACHAQRESA
jgi:hypothetical protein